MARQPQLPDPDALSEADVVIYDGDCNFCRSQVQNLRRLDLGGPRLAFISLHDPRVAKRFADLPHDRLMKEMVVVDTEGRRHGGADAVRYLSRRLPSLWPAAPVLHLPGTARLWRYLYQQVAKRRYKLAGKTGDKSSCENGACSVHLDQ